MPEWWILFVVLWVVLASRRGRGGCGWTRPLPRSTGPGAWPGHPRPRDRIDRPSRGALRRPAAPARAPETAEQRLQRQFVEGRLSMEEYEAALWKELGPERGEGGQRLRPG